MDGETGIFEHLVRETSSRLNLPAASVSVVVQELLSLMASERIDGPDGFVGLFQRAGLGDVVSSWIGGRPAIPITSWQVEAALGTTTLERMGSVSCLTPAAVAAALAIMLPRLVALLTPDGALPPATAIQSLRTQFATRRVEEGYSKGARPAAGGTTGSWPRWLPWTAAGALLAVGLLWILRPSGAVDPLLEVRNRDGQVTYAGLVRDAATAATVASALQAAFGEDNLQGSLRVDRNAGEAAWLPHLGEVLGALNAPGAAAVLRGDSIAVGGGLSSAERDALLDRLNGIPGPRLTFTTLDQPASMP